MSAFVEDVKSDSRYIPGVEGARSEVAYQLLRKGDVVGVLDIESCERLDREDFDNGTFALFAAHCTAALFNASMVDSLNEQQNELQSRARELQVLNHVGRLLGELMSLDDVLNEILRLATETLEIKTCAILLPYSQDHKLLRIRAAVGYPDDVVDTVAIHRGQAVARIIAVADSWDAMTLDRQYRKAIKIEDALAEIQNNAGRQFDPQVVRVFMDILDEMDNNDSVAR